MDAVQAPGRLPGKVPHNESEAEGMKELSSRRGADPPLSAQGESSGGGGRPVGMAPPRAWGAGRGARAPEAGQVRAPPLPREVHSLATWRPAPTAGGLSLSALGGQV